MIYSRDYGKRKPVDIEARKRIRGVYGTEDGQKELFNLFHDAGLFRVIKPEELVLRNAMILKAEELGMLDEKRVRMMISQFFSQDITAMEKKDLEETKDSFDIEGETHGRE